MIMQSVNLSELEKDALTEVVNIGVSRAASALRKMVGYEVLLSVPAVEIVSREKAVTMLGERESSELVAVGQSFSGGFSGRAMLIFPEESSLALARAVTGDELPADELAEMEQEALLETGNIILNSCLATMANMLKQPLTMSLPKVLKGRGADLLKGADEGYEDGTVLFLYINFSVRQRDLRGYIAMMMDLPSLLSLQALLGEFIKEVIGEPQ
jgi:chemotaxis protein CheC